MESGLVAAIIILAVLTVLLIIMICLKFFRRRTTVGMLEEKVRSLQGKDVNTEYELELRQMGKELEGSIATNKEKIEELKK